MSPLFSFCSRKNTMYYNVLVEHNSFGITLVQVKVVQILIIIFIFNFCFSKLAFIALDIYCKILGIIPCL